MIRFFVYGLVFCVLSTANAKHPTEPVRKIKKGAEITVNSYDAPTDTFLLTITGEADVGPNYVTPENLRKAIAFEGNKSDFTKQRAQMISSVYSLKKDLPVLELTDLVVRKKKK